MNCASTAENVLTLLEYKHVRSRTGNDVESTTIFGKQRFPLKDTAISFDKGQEVAILFPFFFC